MAAATETNVTSAAVKTADVNGATPKIIRAIDDEDGITDAKVRLLFSKHVVHIILMSEATLLTRTI